MSTEVAEERSVADSFNGDVISSINEIRSPHSHEVDDPESPDSIYNISDNAVFLQEKTNIITVD